jgi:hypothetical protein
MARARLEKLKFATSQINEIARTRAIIDPLPIISPVAGCVIDPLHEGSTFRKSDRLFSLSSDQCIEVAVEQNVAEFFRPNKLAEVSHFGSGYYASFIGKGAPDSSGKCLCKFRLENATHRGRLKLCFRFVVWERISPKTTAHDWPYPIAPRGQAIYDLGLRKRPPPVVQPVVKRPKRLNPFADNRPQRVLAPYEAPKTCTIDAETHRNMVQMPHADWQNRRISVINAEPQEFTPAWETAATLRVQKDEDYRVSAALSGDFKPLGRVPETFVTSNHVIGYIHPDRGTEQSLIPVWSSCAGLVTDVIAEAHVRAGDKLAIIKPASHVLSIRLSHAPIDPLRLRVCHLARPNDVLFGRPEIRLLSSADRIPAVDVPFPSGLGPFKEGHAFSVFLDEPNASRISLSLPKDCVMIQGKSHEVLVHHGPGKLTPVAVQVGISGDLVEIRHGISRAHHIVRDLEQLCRLDDRLRAAMTGFWLG